MFNSIINKIKKKPAYFFLAKLLAFLLLVFAIDYAVGNLLHYFYFKQKGGTEFRTTFSIDNTKADVLIFGSSRANHHYHPYIFEESLKMTYYNTGKDGSSIIYQYAVLQSVLKRYIPKLIILDIVNKEFIEDADTYDRIASLLPYYDSHPEMRRIIELKSRFEKYKLVSKIYPFNSAVLKIATGNTNSSKKRNPDIKGYIPLTRKWNQPLTEYVSTVTYRLDYKKIAFYEAFIRDCEKAGIQLFIFVSPYFGKVAHTDYSFIIADGIAQKYNIPFYDFSTDSLFTSQPSMFADIRHLNDDGAKLYSAKVADKVINHVKK